MCAIIIIIIIFIIIFIFIIIIYYYYCGLSRSVISLKTTTVGGSSR
jgi:hypothetical protein